VCILCAANSFFPLDYVLLRENCWFLNARKKSKMNKMLFSIKNLMEKFTRKKVVQV